MCMPRPPGRVLLYSISLRKWAESVIVAFFFLLLTLSCSTSERWNDSIFISKSQERHFISRSYNRICYRIKNRIKLSSEEIFHVCVLLQRVGKRHDFRARTMNCRRINKHCIFTHARKEDKRNHFQKLLSISFISVR